VVGIIADVDARGNGRPRPLVLLPLAQAASQGSVAIVGRGPAAAGLAALRLSLRSIVPDAAVYDARSLADARRDVLGPRIFAIVLLGLFCAAVLLLSLVGLHALFVELARERQKETAIRLALGARPRELFSAELRRAGVLLASAAAATLPAWLALPKLMGPVFQDVQAVVWPAAGLSLLLISIFSTAAIGGPSWRASHAVDLPASIR
jgi:ABC-type antimicrobial peptide transport system permease subunit